MSTLESAEYLSETLIKFIGLMSLHADLNAGEEEQPNYSNYMAEYRKYLAKEGCEFQADGSFMFNGINWSVPYINMHDKKDPTTIAIKEFILKFPWAIRESGPGARIV